MKKKGAKPEKTGSEQRAMAESRAEEVAVKKNMERLRALRLDREAEKDK